MAYRIDELVNNVRNAAEGLYDAVKDIMYAIEETPEKEVYSDLYSDCDHLISMTFEDRLDRYIEYIMKDVDELADQNIFHIGGDTNENN